MLISKKKHRPPFFRSFKAFRLSKSARISSMAKKKHRSGPLVVSSVIDSAVSGSATSETNRSSMVSLPLGFSTTHGTSAPIGFVHAAAGSSSPAIAVSGSSTQAQSSPIIPSGFLGKSDPLSVSAPPPTTQPTSPPVLEAQLLSSGFGIVINEPTSTDTKVIPQIKNYAALLKSSAQLQEIGTPVEHVSGAPFVLIPDDNIEAAKLEFKDFIYARFHGDHPSMGKIIGVVNAVWARSGPRIFVHNIGEGIYLLRVTNPRTREVLLSRTCWNIGGLPMFVAPWSPDFSPDEAPLTSAIVPVEMRNVPYLLFNKESLSRIATAIAPLPHQIVSGFSNGREVMIEVSYPWLPVKCDLCKKFGHSSLKCPEGSILKVGVKKPPPAPPAPPSNTARRRSRSRPGRSTEKMIKQGALRYVPVHSVSPEVTKDDVLTGAPVAAEMRITLQEANNGDLEEGEIAQHSQVEPGSSQPSKKEETSRPQMDAVQVSATLDVDKARSNHIIASPNKISFGAFDVLANLPSDDGGNDDFLSLSAGALFGSITQNNYTTVAPAEDGLSTDTMSASSKRDAISDTLVLSAGSSQTDVNLHRNLPVVSDTEQDNNNSNYIHPAEVQERDNPFFLVKNRKSGCKVTKHH
ncbi:hypothetical protein BRARA_C04305 [Brassica rapa]|uniref:DUF4283 domain-containing protein n=1 Tax=Brassica campestris TaxID=3711 RepID=A0A398A3K6_BRACM|nr:hypothetical protein BRARA_C04305 [Brassica rapa]